MGRKKDTQREKSLVEWYIKHRDLEYFTKSTIQEAAEYSGYSPKTLTNYLHQLRRSEHGGRREIVGYNREEGKILFEEIHPKGKEFES